MAKSASNNKVKAAFLAGNLTCMMVVMVGMLFVGYRLGFGRIADKVRTTLLGHRESPVACPEDVLAELTSIRAVIENADNPTGAKQHDSIMVEPDEEFTYRLRSDVEVAGHVLKPKNRFNIDPPVLYMDPSAETSEATQRWIAEQSRNQILYTTTSDGLRTTEPAVTAERKVLLVGDSVCFGVGVDDQHTIASRLQRMLAPDVEVVNGGVGGYDGGQACRKAKKLLAAGDYERLVYIACDNDFNDEPPSAVFERFASLKESLPNGICVLYTPYLEYIQGEFIFGGDGSDNWVDNSQQRRSGCRTACKQHGLEFIDLTDHIRTYQLERQTVFAGFELYADHCHLSNAGNQFAADVLVTRFVSPSAKVTQK